MGYHTSYAFTSPPDVVFDVMADLGLLAGWLTDHLAISKQPDGTVTVGWPPHGREASAAYRTTLCHEEMRLRWAAASGAGDWSGHAVVCALPVGGSVIQIKLALPAALRTMINHVDSIVSQALRRLDAEAVRRTRAAAPLPEAA
jgi:hypothetical protein